MTLSGKAVSVKRILVTGAGGFVGGHLAPFLADAGFDVIAVSRDATLQFRPPRVSVVGFPASSAEWSTLLPSIDGIVHLAGLVHRAANAEDHNTVNHVLAVDIAEAAYRSGVKHFVFVSSIAAQSGPTAPNVLTEADQARPVTPYGEAKLAAENVIKRIGIPVTILRPVAIDGFGAKGNVALLNTLARLPFPLPFGGLHNRRSTLSIGNFNSAVRAVLFNPKAIGETFVVADPSAMSVADIIAAVRRKRGKPANLFYLNQKLLQLALRAAGRGPMWERLGCPLVVDPAKLLSIGWTPEEQ